jgi:hypothetical protein
MVVVHPGNAKQVTFFQKVSPVLHQALLKEFTSLNCLQAMVEIIRNYSERISLKDEEEENI